MSLETYIPEARHLVIAGKPVTVAPLKVRQIPAFARAIAPAAQAVFSGDLMGAVAAHGEALIEAMAIATGESAEWLGELEADAFLALVGEVVEVNADFFVRRVGPALNATVERIGQALTTAGATPSPACSPADSAGATVST